MRAFWIRDPFGKSDIYLAQPPRLHLTGTGPAKYGRWQAIDQNPASPLTPAIVTVRLVPILPSSCLFSVRDEKEGYVTVMVGYVGIMFYSLPSFLSAAAPIRNPSAALLPSR
jgi:hypothetical protein